MANERHAPAAPTNDRRDAAARPAVARARRPRRDTTAATEPTPAGAPDWRQAISVLTATDADELPLFGRMPA